MSFEGGHGGQPSNVSRQVIPCLRSCDRKQRWSEGSAYAWCIEFPFWGCT